MNQKSDKIPLILDTDIGGDIDDAVCLGYLLRQPRCELVGVTTVCGQPQRRASLVDAICRAGGRTDIPIHSGTGLGIQRVRCGTHSSGTEEMDCPQASILSEFEHRKPEDFKPNTALEFLREQIHARPGEITLLAIGPMTNLGILFSMDPEIPRKLKRLVLMCGIFRSMDGVPWARSCEWNALCDPLATSITYRETVQDHLSIGLDVTQQCVMDNQECVERFKKAGGPLSVVAAAVEVYRKHSDKIVFHDPLAAAVIFEPEICGYEKGRVEVELKSDHSAGMTHFDTQCAEKPHRVAMSVNPAMFFEHYFNIIK